MLFLRPSLRMAARTLRCYSKKSHGLCKASKSGASAPLDQAPKDANKPVHGNQTVSRSTESGVSHANQRLLGPSSAPAPMDPQLQAALHKDNKPYVPKLHHQRVLYGYPGLPNEDDFSRISKKYQRPKTTTRWLRYVPKILTALVGIWGAYSVYVWVYHDSEGGADSNELLDKASFHTFVITHKQPVGDDHFLVEVQPKHSQWKYSYYANNKSVWNGDRIWLVEVKQPEIMVVRSYTPLPLYFMQSEYTQLGEREPLLKVINPELDELDRGGTMCFYVKRYRDGEVSRYICNKAVGDEIELRGPRVEYQFPYHPLKPLVQRPVFKDLPSKVEPEAQAPQDLPEFGNLVFFAAGTGIAPALQVLLSRNPYRGFTTVHYLAQKPDELQPLERFLFFLEKLDRLKVVKHYDSERNFLTQEDVPRPVEADTRETLLSAENSLKLRMDILNLDKKASAPAQTTVRAPRYENGLEQAAVTAKEPKKGPTLAIVCGPDGYVEHVAGPKLYETNEQGPVTGLLGSKSWSNTNVFKL